MLPVGARQCRRGSVPVGHRSRQREQSCSVGVGCRQVQGEQDAACVVVRRPQTAWRRGQGCRAAFCCPMHAGCARSSPPPPAAGGASGCARGPPWLRLSSARAFARIKPLPQGASRRAAAHNAGCQCATASRLARQPGAHLASPVHRWAALQRVPAARPAPQTPGRGTSGSRRCSVGLRYVPHV